MNGSNHWQAASHSVLELGPADAALLRSVSCLFGEAFDDLKHYTAAPPSDAHLIRLLQSSGFITLVVIEDDEVIGAVTAYELIKPEHEMSEIYLYDIAVALERRRKGVATALIKQLCRVAARRGAEIVFVQADSDDAEAIALYKHFGKRRDVCHFDMAPLYQGNDA